MTEEIQFYYESFKIVDVAEDTDGTRKLKLEIPKEDGNEYIFITLPEWEYKATVTEHPSDASEARNSRTVVVVDKLYAILKEMDVRVEDIGFISQKLLSKFGGIEEKAINETFGVDNKYNIRLASHYDKQ